MSGPIRKPVAAVKDDFVGTIVVCDDGAAFMWPVGENAWVPCPPIPGTLAARRQANGDRTLEADLVEDR